MSEENQPMTAWGLFVPILLGFIPAAVLIAAGFLAGLSAETEQIGIPLFFIAFFVTPIYLFVWSYRYLRSKDRARFGPVGLLGMLMIFVNGAVAVGGCMFVGL